MNALCDGLTPLRYGSCKKVNKYAKFFSIYRILEFSFFAVLGYEMDMDSFVAGQFVKNTKV